jgi:hypothetical protein
LLTDTDSLSNRASQDAVRELMVGKAQFLWLGGAP